MTKISPVVKRNEWLIEFPNVDREYVWNYPLINSTPFDDGEIFKDNAIIPIINDELNLYINMPYCSYRCPMCPFFVEIIDPEKNTGKINDYCEGLLKELEIYKKSGLFTKFKLKSIYFGGGTATLIPSKYIKKIIESLKDYKDTIEEITVENHPKLATYNYLKEIKEAGVTRVSFGVQSFEERFLRTLKLNRTVTDSINAINNSKEIGFKTISIDLLYRIPGQSIKDIKYSIDKAIELGVSSISTYSLELSVRDNDMGEQPKESIDKEMFDYINKYLTDNGFEHHAQPDYAKKQNRCKEIEITWKAPQGQFLGLGAGAWSTVNHNTFCNLHNIEEYLKVVEREEFPIYSGKKHSYEDALSRHLVLGARCFEIPYKMIGKAFDVNILEVFKREIDWLLERDLVEVTDSLIKLTHLGKYYVDNVSKEFYSLENRCRRQPWGATIEGKKRESYYGVENIWKE